jgi:predicted HTH domain antitoxin
MSTLHIPDDILDQAGISESEALLELACRLFDTGKLSLFFAARLAKLPAAEFQEVLLKKNIPIYRVDEADLDNDLKTLRSRT